VDVIKVDKVGRDRVVQLTGGCALVRYVGYDYKEAVLNPTNPRDQATEWESQLIEQFRSGHATKELTGFHGDGMARTMIAGGVSGGAIAILYINMLRKSDRA